MIPLRHIAIALAVIGTPAAALAQTVTTTTTTVERSGPARLSPQQRTTIYRTVTQERRVAPEVQITRERRVVPAEVDYTIGRPVPPSVALEPLPESVYVETPTLPRYKYFYVNNRMMLVDPATSEVVDILDQ
jgi:hypothetical protein